MIKISLVYVAVDCCSFLATKSLEGWDFPSRRLPRASTGQQESTPGITIPPATQAEKFTCLVTFIQVQITCCGLEEQIIRHYYWIVYICRGSILSLV